MHYIFEPGLLSSGPVRTAVLVGTVVAVTSGVVGVLTVIRGQSFAGHSLADVATGVVLGAALGVAALFLYLGTLTSSTTGASFTILFGSMFVISLGTVPALIASGVLALAVVAVLARVLLLTALSPDLAAARGVPVRAVGVAYLAALRVTRTPVRAMTAAALAGTAATWLGILLAYDSYYWPPRRRRPGRGDAAPASDSEEARACSPA